MTLDPAPVEVTNAEPIPVVLSHPEAPIPVTMTTEQTPVSARIDADILRTQDQRRISGIWERTQQVIALAVVFSTLAVIFVLVWRQDDDTKTALAILFGLANLVIGFYFGRTNHTRVGGVGPDNTR